MLVRCPFYINAFRIELTRGILASKTILLQWLLHFSSFFTEPFFCEAVTLNDALLCFTLNLALGYNTLYIVMKLSRYVQQI